MKNTLLIILGFWVHFSIAQSISSSLPNPINPTERYMFYLHGGVASVLGDNAINRGAPEWGPYEYSNILDTLRRKGFNIISEIRKQNTGDSFYINKVKKQVDTLLASGVPTRNIILLGASSGWDIVLHSAHLLKNKNLRYVIMGGCWADTFKDYRSLKLRGHFLSIIESSDPHGTCNKIFETHNEMASRHEVTLNTGLSHGFFYKGRSVWIDPVMKWFNETR